VGKSLIGLYLGHSSVASSYGAAGSLLVLLLWVYYSSLLVFVGAELTQVQAQLGGQPIEPDEHAEWDTHPTTPPPGGRRPATT
jgi:membrane protein